MSAQQQLPFSPPPPQAVAVRPQQTGISAPSASGIRPPATQEAGAVPAPVWLQRLSLAVLVIFCLYLGLLISVLPWWHEMWDHNPMLLQHPAARAFLMQGWVRGAVSGLGLLDLWIGISELIHYRDYRR